MPNKTLKGPVAIQIKDLEQYFTTPSDDSAVIFDDVSVKEKHENTVIVIYFRRN